MNIKKKPTQSKRIAVNKKFFIVGIGASAGGLEALSQVLLNLPAYTGMAFIVIQHLDPTHESMLVNIFSKLTSMAVLEAKEGLRVKPNHIYVIPPNYVMKISQGVLKLLPRMKMKGSHLPIDYFFQSLAKDQTNKSIGIVLSGTAFDGTRGLEAIKIEGGLTIAQEPKSAKYDDMPRSAISSGVIDLVLSPKEIATELAHIAQHPLLTRQAPKLGALSHVLEKNEEDTFPKILMILQTRCHVDFRHYKQSTVKRRIRRRMVLQKKKNLKDYLEYLQANIDEAKFLFEEIIIKVTEFFRDRDCFAELKEQIFPEIIKEKSANSPIRIWVVGCATGEEAYSVAMSLLEYLGESSPSKKIMIFATDISEVAIRHARAGIYPASIKTTLSEERLEKFFKKTPTGYRIDKSIREMCLFSRHDIIEDTPFAKLDLICCRNLLIYFDSVLQKRILSIFHYALNPRGCLWLGNSESVGQLSTLFSPIDKKNKFYSRNVALTTAKFQLPIRNYISEKLGMAKKFSEHIQEPSDIQKEADRVASLVYAPPGVVVNNEMEIVLIRGKTTPYLRLYPGQASFNLFKMARTEIVSDLRMAIHAAKKKNAPTKKNGLMLKVGRQLRKFNLDVIPFDLPSSIKEHYFLISFEASTHSKISPLEESSVIAAKIPGNKLEDSKDRAYKEIERELDEVKAYHQFLIHDFEATQEGLTLANEELQSTNEELQSTNEELETAKEELQSTNEELRTLNDELQSRSLDITQLNNDLINLISCIDIPIIIVDINGCIRRFTAKASQLMNFVPSDVGRPISDFKPNISVPNIAHFVLDAIETMTTKELDVQDQEGKWFRLQARPYKTTDNRIDGAIISLVDINVLKSKLKESKTSLDYAVSIINTVPLPLVVLDNQLRLKSANNSFYEMFRIVAKNNETDFLSLLGNKVESAVPLGKILNEVFLSNQKLEHFEIEYKFSNVERCIVQLNAQKIHWINESEPSALLLSVFDVTKSHDLQIELRETLAAKDRANQSKDIFLAMLSHELRTPLTPILSWAQFLQTKEGPTKLKHGLKIIEQSAITQAQLIDDLLDISRIQSGKLILNISKVDIKNIVQMAVESVRTLAEKKSIAIVTHIKSLKGKVAADPARLQQIVWNLLTNAIKFSPEHGVVDVYVNTLKEQGHLFAVIKIIDYGKGIEPNFLPQIFERFTQANIATTRFHGGLGIGLSIVYDLVKLLGGSIRAESAGEKQGATFTVLLPLLANGLKQKKKIQDALASDEEAVLRQKLSGLTALIVEDEQNALDAFTELLQSVGMIATPAHSVAEALAALEQCKFDLLVSDIAMPQEDGYSLISKVRARESEQGGRIPALALTAYATQEDVSRALSSGFNAHLAKPFDAIDLFRIMANLAKSKR